jgi:hypothetical protein
MQLTELREILMKLPLTMTLLIVPLAITEGGLRPSRLKQSERLWKQHENTWTATFASDKP